MKIFKACVINRNLFIYVIYYSRSAAWPALSHFTLHEGPSGHCCGSDPWCLQSPSADFKVAILNCSWWTQSFFCSLATPTVGCWHTLTWTWRAEQGLPSSTRVPDRGVNFCLNRNSLEKLLNDAGCHSRDLALLVKKHTQVELVRRSSTFKIDLNLKCIRTPLLMSRSNFRRFSCCFIADPAGCGSPVSI